MLRFSLIMLIISGLRITSLEPISLSNADHIEQIRQIGYGTVSQFDWIADSNQLAVITEAGVIFYENNGVDVSEPVLTLWETGGTIVNASFYNGQTTLVVRREDQSVFVRHVESNQVVEIPDNLADGFLWDSALSPDGGWLATIRALACIPCSPIPNDIHVWNTQTGELIATYDIQDTDYITNIAFALEGATLLIMNRQGVTLWDIRTNIVFREIPLDHPVGAVLRGHWIVLSDVNDEERVFNIWDLQTSEIVASIYPTDDFRGSYTISPDGQYLVLISQNGTLSIWSVLTEEEITSIQLPNDYIPNPLINFSPDSRFLALSDRDRVIHLYETSTWTAVNTLEGFMPSIRALAFNPDDSLLVFGGTDSILQIWDTHNAFIQNSLATRQYSIEDLDFSSDGDTLFVSDVLLGVSMWNVADWTPLASADLSTVDYTDMRDMTVSPDGSILATASYNDITLTDTTTYTEIFPLIGHQDAVNSLAFSPDGSIIASVGGIPPGDEGYTHDYSLRLWDVETGLQIMMAQNNAALQSVAYSSDGTLVATGDFDGVITLWDTHDLTPVSTLTGHSSGINALLFSRDGSLLISASNDTTIRLWDIVTHAEVRVLEGHTGWIGDLALSFDGTLLASAGDDGTVRLWGVSL